MTLRVLARFYDEVSVLNHDGGYCVLLDGNALKTPGRVSLILPTRPLAEAVAQEWREQGERVEPARMPLTGLAYAVVDGVPRMRGRIVEHILGYGRSDLLCYRVEDSLGARPMWTHAAVAPPAAGATPALPGLAARQAEIWDPLLDWMAGAHGVHLRTGAGVAHIEQPADALLTLEKLVSTLDDFQLAGLARAAALTGSLVVALGLLEGRLDVPKAFAAGHLDELYQAEKWGRDAGAEDRRAGMLTELEAAERFLRLAADRQT